MSAYLDIKKETWRMRLAPYTRLLVRWGWFIVLLMILVTSMSRMLPDVLSSTGYRAELQIQVELLGASGIANAKDATKFFNEILLRPDTLNLAVLKLNKIEQFKTLQVSDLALLISVSDAKGTNVVDLAVVSDTPQDASLLITTIYQAFLAKIHSDRSMVVNGLVSMLNTDLQQVQNDLANSGATMQGLKVTGGTSTPAYNFISSLHEQQRRRADHINALLLQLQQQGFGPKDILQLVSNTPLIQTIPGTGPTQGERLALSPLIGLIMGLGALVLINRFSNAVPLRGKKRDEVLPHISAVFPRLPSQQLKQAHLKVLERMSSECLPLLRRLRYQHGEFGKRLRVITVTSPRGREGKSTIATSLSIAAAKSGMRTILVDANASRPVLHSWFQLSQENGTMDLASSFAANISRPLSTASTSIAELDVLPIGVKASGSPPHGFAGELNSTGLRALVEVLREQAELVVIDGPSLLADVGAAHLMMMSDVVLLTVDAQKSQGTQILEAEDILSKLGVTFAVMLNRSLLKAAE